MKITEPDSIAEGVIGILRASDRPLTAEDVSARSGMPLDRVEETLIRCGRHWHVKVRDGLWAFRDPDDDPHRRKHPAC